MAMYYTRMRPKATVNIRDHIPTACLWIFFLLATAWFSILLIIYHLLITWANKNRSMRTGPPEPEGRTPVIGHLHLFVGPEPLARKLGDRYG
ncbi:hypothetical protein AAC387_Pa04g2224 [Persea americana]